MLSTSENKRYFTIEQRIRQDLLLLFSVNGKFKEDIIEIRKKHNIPENGTGEQFIAIDDTNEKYKCDITELRKKYNLSEAYEMDLRILIESEQAADLHELNFFWHLKPFQYSDPENPMERFVAVKLYPETTLQDIIDYWPEIKERRDSMLNLKTDKKQRQDKRGQLDRDLYIFSLYKQKMTRKKIAETIRKDDRFNGKKIYEMDVSKIIQRLKSEAKNITNGKYKSGIFRDT